jgi:ATP-dependent RNA helicase DHX8/PRP22
MGYSKKRRGNDYKKMPSNLPKRESKYLLYLIAMKFITAAGTHFINIDLLSYCLHHSNFSDFTISICRLRLDVERRELPMWSAREKLIQAVKKSPVLVVVGETGSGKTTQIPQFLLDAGFAGTRGLIACTQPRRVAAMTVAQRVAQERGCELGEEVGYTVRFDDCTGPSTRIKYMTDGMLLREALLDPKLKRYSVVILDEAHERTVSTDVLLGLLKAAREARKGDFRLLVMSATLDAAGFTRYFPESGAAYVEGRQHPVEILYTATPQDSYLDAAITTALQVHCDESSGDILVFLTGQDEIEAAERLLNEKAAALPLVDLNSKDFPRPALLVIPMYAALPPEAQMKAFTPALPGVRKIVLCTNIAETSVTIPGVRYVIDSGVVKTRAYSARLGADCLEVCPVSQAQARQRSGRAGREGPGKAFRLYAEDTFAQLTATTEPEIKRANLATVVLQLKALGIADPLSFDFMDSPPKLALLRALELLLALGALDNKGNLTDPMGTRLARLPVDPMYGRCLIMSGDLGCSEEMLGVVAMVSCDAAVFISPGEKREEAMEAHRRFAARHGDHLTSLAVFIAWKAVPQKDQKRWCSENFINSRALRKANDVYLQLKGHLEDLKIPLRSCGDGDSEYASLRRALVTGLFPHAAKLQIDGNKYRVVSTGQEVFLHPSSVLHGKRAECIVFNELVRTTKQYARGVSAVESGWLAELVPAYFTRMNAN